MADQSSASSASTTALWPLEDPAKFVYQSKLGYTYNNIAQQVIDLAEIHAESRFKYKYREAFPAPDGVDYFEWNKSFSAADSSIYTKKGHDSKQSSATRRNTNETRDAAEELQHTKDLKKLGSSTDMAGSKNPPKARKIASMKKSKSASPNPPSFPLVQTETFDMRSPAVGSRENTPAESINEYLLGAFATATIAEKVKNNSRSRLSGPTLPEDSPQAMKYRAYMDSVNSAMDEAPQTSYLNSGADTQRYNGEYNTDRSNSEARQATSNSGRSATPMNFTSGRGATPTVSTAKSTAPKASRAKKGTAAPKKKQSKKPQNTYGKDDKNAQLAAKVSSSPYGSEEESEADTDDGGTYCICGGPDDHTYMIACDGECGNWYHGRCVGLQKRDGVLLDQYICPNCKTEERVTTWKPHCRYEGCRMPVRLDLEVPSKYCSDEHRIAWAKQMVGMMPDSNKPSRGGELTKGELRAVLEQTKDVNKFHALGKPPSLQQQGLALQNRPSGSRENSVLGGEAPPASGYRVGQAIGPRKNAHRRGGKVVKLSELQDMAGVPKEERTKKDDEMDIDEEDVVRPSREITPGWDPSMEGDRSKFVYFDEILDSEDQVRMDNIERHKDDCIARIEYLEKFQTYIGMVKARVDVVLAELKPKGYKEICGYDPRLTLNEHDFTEYLDTNEAKRAFSTGALGEPEDYTHDRMLEDMHSGVCVKKRCTKHNGWHRAHITDCRFDIAMEKKKLYKLEAEEKSLWEAAEIEAAIKRDPRYIPEGKVTSYM